MHATPNVKSHVAKLILDRSDEVIGEVAFNHQRMSVLLRDKYYYSANVGAVATHL